MINVFQKINTHGLGVIFFLLPILFCFSCSTKEHTVDSYLGISIPIDIVDKYLQLRMEELAIPGLSIAIINDGKVAYHNTFGYANLEKEQTVTNQTIFEGASISKSVFAFFVMTFVEEGKLDLDKPLFEYLPHQDIKDDERYKKVTARMVLSHRSGFPNWREHEDDKKLKTKFEPGTDYLYSGEAFQYLTLVLMHIMKTDHDGLEKLFQKKDCKSNGT